MRHPSDASGWSFLLFSLRLTKDSKLVRDTVREIVKRAVHLRLGGEALWRFLVQAVEEDDLVAWGPRIEVAEAIKAYMGELKRKAVRQEPAGRMMSAEERWLIEFIRRLQ